MNIKDFLKRSHGVSENPEDSLRGGKYTNYEGAEDDDGSGVVLEKRDSDQDMAESTAA